jgi:hypothetical protein
MKIKQESIKNHVPNGLLTLIVAAILLASIAPIASAGWDCRKPVTINNPGDALSDYQVLVTLNSSNFDYSKTSPDGSDLRFTDYNNSVSYYYWIETWNITGTSKIWVNVFSVPSVDSKMYMWHNNPSAGSESDGDVTFVFFDDFEGTSLDTSKWNVVTNRGILDVVDGYLRLYRPANMGQEIASVPSFSGCTIIEYRQKILQSNYYYSSVYYGTSPDISSIGYSLYPAYESALYTGSYKAPPRSGSEPSTCGDIITDPPVNEWFKEKFIVLPGHISRVLNDGGKETSTRYAGVSSGKIGLCASSAFSCAMEHHTDWIFVRKYTDTDPKVEVSATEEDVTGMVDPVPKLPIPTYIRDTDTDDDGVPDVWDADNSTPTEYWTDRQGVGRMWGDMNGDGKLTSVDALMILQAAADAIGL